MDLALNLTSLSACYLSKLFEGSPVTEEERDCEFLLKSKLLQRCIWKQPAEETGEQQQQAQKGEDKQSQNVVSEERLSQLRSLCHSRMPPLRASAKQVLRPEALEEGIVAAVIKHLALSEVRACEFILYFLAVY